MRSINVTCVVLGKMANLDAERGCMSPKISPPLKAEHFRDVLEPNAVGIAVDEKHRRLCGLELVGLNHRMVSINSALKVDLNGQILADAIGARQFSGSSVHGLHQGTSLSLEHASLICLNRPRRSTAF